MANLAVAKFGTSVVLIVGFVLIGLDLTVRDYLHEIWEEYLWANMAALIVCGSIITFALNRGAGQVALASVLAFFSAAFIDTIVYHLLGKRSFLIRVNGSNVFSSFADSSIFLTVAFGSFMPALIFAQFAVKLWGGFMWSLLLRKFREKQ